MGARIALFSTLIAASALAAEKPAIVYKAPAPTEDDRPVAVEIVVGPQGSDYAFKVEFNKVPWGESCHTRCANATIFLDTDNNKATGLKLKDAKAPECGADLAVTIQGTRESKEGRPASALKVRVKQLSDDSAGVDEGSTLADLDSSRDPERLLADGTSVYILVDANVGNLPSGQKIRVVYHPPDAKPLVGTAKGLSAPGANHVEIFKDGKLANPVSKKKKSDYEKF